MSAYRQSTVSIPEFIPILDRTHRSTPYTHAHTHARALTHTHKDTNTQACTSKYTRNQLNPQIALIAAATYQRNTCVLTHTQKNVHHAYMHARARTHTHTHALLEIS